MSTSILQGKKVLITAGPTREAIDPVRYISNHSTGKMGYALAAAFLAEGAEVILISGPVSLSLQHLNLKIIQTQSAGEMYLTCCHFFEEVDIAVFAAAVADYRPAVVAEQKIKKAGDELVIRMVKNIDIASEFGKMKYPHQLAIGFALETNDELFHAAEKLSKKNFDFIVLNSMNDANAGFGYDTNKISIMRSDLSFQEFPLKNKAEAAADIVTEAANALAAKLVMVRM